MLHPSHSSLFDHRTNTVRSAEHRENCSVSYRPTHHLLIYTQQCRTYAQLFSQLSPHPSPTNIHTTVQSAIAPPITYWHTHNCSVSYRPTHYLLTYTQQCRTYTQCSVSYRPSHYLLTYTTQCRAYTQLFSQLSPHPSPTNIHTAVQNIHTTVQSAIVPPITY